MAAYLRRSNANAHGAFATSQETDEVIAEAHRAAADLLNADADEVVFGPNATTLLFAISRSVGRTLGPGDEVVVTRLDHDANVRPWVLAAEDAGATVRWVDIRDDDATLDPASFEAALSERTEVVAFTLASNAVGTITPAAELARLVHERTPAIVACDGVHLAQHRRIDVRAVGADLVVCSPYKIFGPHLGILFGRRDAAVGAPPLQGPAAPRTRSRSRSRPGRRTTRGSPAGSPRWATSRNWARQRSAGGPPWPTRSSGRSCRTSAALSERFLERDPQDRRRPPLWHRGRRTAWTNARPRSRSASATSTGRDREGARRARGLRVGRQLLRARDHGAARAPGLGWGGPDRLLPLQHPGRGGPGARELSALAVAGISAVARC